MSGKGINGIHPPPWGYIRNAKTAHSHLTQWDRYVHPPPVCFMLFASGGCAFSGYAEHTHLIARGLQTPGTHPPHEKHDPRGVASHSLLNTIRVNS